MKCLKYPNWGPGRVEARLNILGADKAEALLRRRVTATFQDAVPMLLDGSGRRIPWALQSAHRDPNASFHLLDPKLNLGEGLAKLAELFPAGTKFMPEKEYCQRIVDLVERIGGDEQIANALKGPYFAFCLPQIEAGDYGEILDGPFAAAMAASYGRQFPERQFNQYRKGQLTRNTKIVDGSHRGLVELMVKGPVAVILTVPLQGFSVHADREQISELAGFDFISLAGGLDFVTAITLYPETLARDFYRPGLNMSAVQWQSREYSLFFKANDDYARFDVRSSLDCAFEFYSGGLVFRG